MSFKAIPDIFSANPMDFKYTSVNQEEEEGDQGLDLINRIELLNKSQLPALTSDSNETLETGQRVAKFILCAQTQLGGTYAIADSYKEAEERLAKLKNSSGAELHDENCSGTRSIVRTTLFDNQGPGSFSDERQYEEPCAAYTDENVVRGRSEGEVSYLLVEGKDCSMSKLFCKTNEIAIESRVSIVNFNHPDKAAQLSTVAGLKKPIPQSCILKEINKNKFNENEATALRCETLKSSAPQSFVPELYAVGTSDKFVLLAEEKVAGMELSIVIEKSREKPLSQAALFHIAEATVKSCAALEKANIAHLDVKPENAILRCNVACADVPDNDCAQQVDLEKPVTLCHIDFGYALGMQQNEFSSPTKAQLCGTPQYMSPQMVKNIKQWYDFEEKQSKAGPPSATMSRRSEENFQHNSLCESLLSNLAPSMHRLNSEDEREHDTNFDKRVGPSADYPSDTTLPPSSYQSFVNPFFGESSVGRSPDCEVAKFPSLHASKKSAEKVLKFQYVYGDNIQLPVSNLPYCEENGNPYQRKSIELTHQYELFSRFSISDCEETVKAPEFALERNNDYQSAALVLYAVANGGSFFSMPDAKTFRERVQRRYNLEQTERDNFDVENSAFISKLDELHKNEGLRERFPQWFIRLLKAMYLGHIGRLDKHLKDGKEKLKVGNNDPIDSQNVVHDSSSYETAASCLNVKPQFVEQLSVHSLGITLNPSHQHLECQTRP